MVGGSIRRLIPPERQPEEDDILARLSRGDRIEHFETVRVAKNGRRLDVSVTISPLRNAAGAIVGASTIVRNISAARESASTMEALNNVGTTVTSDLDREKVVQAVNSARSSTTWVGESGESYTLYTISGVPREAFSQFPMPRNRGLDRPERRHHEGSALRAQSAASRHPARASAGAQLPGGTGQGALGRRPRRAVLRTLRGWTLHSWPACRTSCARRSTPFSVTGA
jgi:hypothetical protein